MVVFVVRLDERIGRISPRLHGHFLEHVGTGVYGGVWEEERQCLHEGVVALVQALTPPVLRWPGGCFAEKYDWRDGVGPRAKRPRRVNTSWGSVPETNAFGTEELLALCERLGAEPYLAGNVSTGTPELLAAWVAHCGDRVRLWGIGNEPWGCGGDMTAREYARRYVRFAETIAAHELVACGADGADTSWTTELFEELQRSGARPRVDAYAVHYYVGAAGTATAYSEDDFVTLLARAHATDALLGDHLEAMRRVGVEGVVLALDEWGTWHPAAEGHAPSSLWQAVTVRDGLVAAVTLDALHRRANVVKLANLAQLVNVLMAPIHRDGDVAIPTAVHPVLRLHAAHRGGTAVVVDVDAPSLPGMPQVTGSASLHDRRTCVTLTNASPRDAVEVDLRLRPAAVEIARADTVVLAAESHRDPTFAAPTSLAVHHDHGRARFLMPPRAVARLIFELR